MKDEECLRGEAARRATGTIANPYAPITSDTYACLLFAIASSFLVHHSLLNTSWQSAQLFCNRLRAAVAPASSAALNLALSSPAASRIPADN